MDFLYIITKQEFTSLYRFGSIPVIQEKILEIKGMSDKDIEADIVKSFMSLPYFVGDEEYLFIGFNQYPNNNKLPIGDVLEIIPLTDAARHSYQMKFDKKIIFSQAKFTKAITKVEEQIDIQERLSGAEAFWILCKVKEPYSQFVSLDKIEYAYHNRINGLKSNNFVSDFFVHALVYERYDFFPNSDLGFLYDVGEIFAHSKQKQSFKGSGYHTFLEQNKPIFDNKSILELIDFISKASEIEKFTEQLTINGLKQYIVTALFFKFKSDLQEKDSIKRSETGKIIGTLRNTNQFIPELNAAIFLTGLFFGYEKFYDDLYELSGLHIFKTYNEPSTENTKVSEPKVEQKPKLQTENRLTINSKKPDKVVLPTNDETEKIKIETKVENTFLNIITDLVQKSGGLLQIKGDTYKEIQKLISDNCESTAGFKKKDFLNKLQELTKNSFEVDTKKEIIKTKESGTLFT